MNTVVPPRLLSTSDVPSWEELATRAGMDRRGACYEGHALFLDEQGDVPKTDGDVRSFFDAWLSRVELRLVALS